MRFSAAFILVVVASRPLTARSNTDFSFSSEAWNAVDEVLSCVASERRESVRDSCSRRSVERASSEVWVWSCEVCFGVVVGRGLWRFRSVDVGGGVGVASVVVGAGAGVCRGAGVGVGVGSGLCFSRGGPWNCVFSCACS